MSTVLKKEIPDSTSAASVESLFLQAVFGTMVSANIFTFVVRIPHM